VSQVVGVALGSKLGETFLKGYMDRTYRGIKNTREEA